MGIIVKRGAVRQPGPVVAKGATFSGLLSASQGNRFVCFPTQNGMIEPCPGLHLCSC